MAACVSGAVASSLSYEQIIAGDQFGFLLGKIVVNVKDTVSDSQINATKVETYVHISSHLPCSHKTRFYDRRGKIITENLKSILKDKQKEIVGWYRFRRNSTLQVSLLENAVHKSLMQSLDIAQPENFVFLLTTASTSYNMATHSYDHILYKFSHSSNEFLPISLSVINLGDTTHSQYKPYGTATNLQTGIYQTVVQKFENRFHDERGDIREVGLVKELSANLLTQLEKISSLVSDEEKQLESLEAEVEVYEKKVNELNKTSQTNSSFASQNVHRLEGYVDATDNEKACQRLTTNNHLITDFLKNDETKRKLKLEVILKNLDTKNWLHKQPNEDFGPSQSANPIRTETQNTDGFLYNKLSTPMQATVQNLPHYNTISTPSNKVTIKSTTNTYNTSTLRNATEHSLKTHSLKHSLNNDELHQEPSYVILPVGASLNSTQNYPKLNKSDDNSSPVMCNVLKANRCSLPKCKPHNCPEEHDSISSNQHINDIQSFHKKTQPSDAVTDQSEIGTYNKLAINNNTMSVGNIGTTKYLARHIQDQHSLSTNFPLHPDISLAPTSNHQSSSLSLHPVSNNPKSKMYVETQESPVQSNDSSISRGREESAGCGEN